MAKAGKEGKATDKDGNTLDLTGNTASGVHVTGATTTDSDGNGFEGVVTWTNSAGVVLGTLDFESTENNILPFLTPGTLIGTPKGERKIEDLVVGDRVITRSDGIQEIRLIGTKSSWLVGYGIKELVGVVPSKMRGN